MQRPEPQAVSRWIAWLLAAAPPTAVTGGTSDPELRRAAAFAEQRLEATDDARFFWSSDFDSGHCRLSLVREDRAGGNRLHAWVPMAAVRVAGTRDGGLALACGQGRCIAYRQILSGERIDGELTQVALPPLGVEATQPTANALSVISQLCRDPYGTD